MGIGFARAFDWFAQAVGIKSPRLEFFVDTTQYQRNVGRGILAAFSYRLTRWGRFKKFLPTSVDGTRLTFSSLSGNVDFTIPSWSSTNKQPTIMIEGINVIYWLKNNCMSRVDIFVTYHSERETMFQSQYMVSLTFADPKEAMLFKLLAGHACV